MNEPGCSNNQRIKHLEYLLEKANKKIEKQQAEIDRLRLENEKSTTTI